MKSFHVVIQDQVCSKLQHIYRLLAIVTKMLRLPYGALHAAGNTQLVAGWGAGRWHDIVPRCC